MDSGPDLAREPKVVVVMAAVGCMFDTVAEIVEAHWVYEGTVPADHRKVAETAGAVGHPLASRQKVSTRLEVVFAGDGEGRPGDDSL